MMEIVEETQSFEGSTRHVSSNFGMFGFNAEHALFQSIKELVENALDASRHGQCEILINIREHENPEVCVLEVLDNGSGIPDVSRSLGCFATSKTSSDYTAGKFGVGLSSVMLYSQVFTNSSLRIITKPNLGSGTGALCTISDCSFNETSGQVNILYEQHVSVPAFPCGTKIRVNLPLPSEIGHSLARTAEYFRKLRSISKSSVSIKMTICLPQRAINECIESVSYSCAPRDNSESELVLFADILGVQINDIAMSTYVHDDNRGSVVNVSFILSFEPAGISPSLHQLGVIDVELWRFANSVPLLEYDDDALSCCMSASLKRFPWANYGLKVKIDHRDDGTENFMLAWINEDITLKQTRIPHKLFVHINLLSPNVPFSSMRKTSISHDADLMQAIKTACNGAMRNIQHQFPVIFMSLKDYKEASIIQSSVPSVSRSIASIIHHSQV